MRVGKLALPLTRCKVGPAPCLGRTVELALVEEVQVSQPRGQE